MHFSYSEHGMLPAVVDRTVQECLLTLCIEERDQLRMKLLESGAILFRGFPTRSISEFAEFAAVFTGRPLLDYTAGASPRTKLGGGVYTSTEYPNSFTLPMHNELSYTFSWPEYLFFMCLEAAPAGGETPLGDSRKILQKIDPGVVARFEANGIRYDRILEDELASQYSWQAAFETNDRSIVEQYCKAGDITLKWSHDGSVFLSEVRPATAAHPATGEKVWFNQADGFHPSILDPDSYVSNSRPRLNAFFGDGSEIDVEDLNHIREVIKNEAVLISWELGDVLIVENMLTCHGRMPYMGDRKILLAMG